MPNEVKLLPCEDRDFVDRLKTDPQNVANQLLALTSISDWARVQHRDNFDGYLIAAAELLTRPTTVVIDEVVERPLSFAWTATEGYKHYPPYVNISGNRIALRGEELFDGEHYHTGPYAAVELPPEAMNELIASMPTVVTGEQPDI